MRVVSFNVQSASAEGFEPMVEQLSEATAWDAIAPQEVSFPWENWVSNRHGLVRHGHFPVTNADKHHDTAILVSRQWASRILRQHCCRWCVGVCLQTEQGNIGIPSVHLPALERLSELGIDLDSALEEIGEVIGLLAADRFVLAGDYNINLLHTAFLVSGEEHELLLSGDPQESTCTPQAPDADLVRSDQLSLFACASRLNVLGPTSSVSATDPRFGFHWTQLLVVFGHRQIRCVDGFLASTSLYGNVSIISTEKKSDHRAILLTLSAREGGVFIHSEARSRTFRSWAPTPTQSRFSEGRYIVTWTIRKSWTQASFSLLLATLLMDFPKLFPPLVLTRLRPPLRWQHSKSSYSTQNFLQHAHAGSERPLVPPEENRNPETSMSPRSLRESSEPTASSVLG